MTDELDLKKMWMEKAKKVTPETLMDFYKELQDFQKLKPDGSGSEWSYNTVCDAMAAFGVAAMTAFDKGNAGGITGYQASWVMWLFIQAWMDYDDQPMRLLKYEEFLYPQYSYKFNQIDKETWKWIQEKALRNLEDKSGMACDEVIEHWQSIVDGKVPFGLQIE